MAVTTTYSFVNVTGEFGVNGTTAGSQTASALARRLDGNLFIAFQTDEVAPPSQNVLARIASPTGILSAADFSVQSGLGDLETVPKLAVMNNSAVVAVYTDNFAAGSTGGTSTVFRIFNGTTGQAPIVFENESDDQTAPAIAPLGGGFVIAHLDQFSGSAVFNSVSVQRYNADGTTDGGQINVADSANGSPFRTPTIAALADGGFVVVWTGDVTAGVGENYDVFAQRYTAAGLTNGALITINDEADNQSNPTVVALASGGFAVAWEDEENGGTANGNIDIRTVDAVGALGALQTISRGGRQERPSIAALGDLFVITYATDENGNQDILATAASSTALLANYNLEIDATAQTQPASVALFNGAFATSWTDATGDGSGTRISAQTDRLGRTSVGDGDSDSIIGDDLSDTVDGGNGIDTIDGGAGDDLLQGGLSSDSISGGAGNDMVYSMTAADPIGSGVGDTLNGGLGDDTLIGSSGSDIISGDDGSDVIDGGLGSDTLQGGLNADTINGGGGNDLIFANVQADPAGSSVGDVLAGDAGNDTITGSGGADLLFGGVGNDSLVGGGVNDVLYGDAGNDTMLGGAGEDQYVVDDVGDVVTELGAEGTADTAYVGVNGWAGFANIEIIRLFGTASSVAGSDGAEQIVANGGLAGGSTLAGLGGTDVLWGSAFGDVLDGGGGSDTIRGGAGADTMYGGDGPDVYVIEDLGDQMIETPGGGYDTAYVSVSGYVMPSSGGAFGAFIEVAYLSGAANYLNGSSSGENLVANPNFGSVLVGFGGNDVLYGSAFGDSFTGGTADDIIYSGGGADAIRFIESNWGFDQVSDFTPAAGDRLVFSAASGVTSFGQLAVINNGVNTQLSFGGNSVLLYNYIGFNAGDVQFIA